MRRIGRVAAASVAMLALAACSEAIPEVTPSPTDAFLVPQGPGTSGPVELLGAGDAFDSRWRYGIHPTDHGPCLQLDLDGSISVRCDDVLPKEDAAFGSVGVATSETSGATVIDGIATEAVATIWVISEDQRRALALLIPLADWEVDGQAFLGTVAGGTRPTHVMALAFNGEVLQTYELP